MVKALSAEHLEAGLLRGTNCVSFLLANTHANLINASRHIFAMACTQKGYTNFFLYTRGTAACIWDHCLYLEGQVDEYQRWKRTVRGFVRENPVLVVHRPTLKLRWTVL